MHFVRGRWRCVKVPSIRAGNSHFTQGRLVSRMADYTLTELVGMYMSTDCIGPSAQMLHRERYTTRYIPSHNIFPNLHQRLAETVSFQTVSRETSSMNKSNLAHAVRFFLSSV